LRKTEMDAAPPSVSVPPRTITDLGTGLDEPDQMVALRWAFREQHFVLRGHALQEMLVDALTTRAIRDAGGESELLEDYPDREHGHTKLLLGETQSGDPVHMVVNVARFEDDFSEPLVVVTVYRPTTPWWLDGRTRRGGPT
jgi:hypothetical protein